MRSVLLAFGFSLSLIAGGLVACDDDSGDKKHLDTGSVSDAGTVGSQDSGTVSGQDAGGTTGSCQQGEQCCAVTQSGGKACIVATSCTDQQAMVPDDTGMCDTPATGCPASEMCYKYTGMTAAGCWIDAGNGGISPGSGATECDQSNNCPQGTIKLADTSGCACFQACTVATSCSDGTKVAVASGGNCFCLRGCQ